MKFKPKAIFFDWDHTLWDHDRNAREVLFELLDEFNLNSSLNLGQNQIWEHYQGLNNLIWDEYQSGKISQETLRNTRFVRFFEGIEIDGNADLFSAEFLVRSPRKTHLFEQAERVIQQLAQKYPLYILTNGFDDTQYIKVGASGLDSYFKAIVTSQNVGVPKPHPSFYQHALTLANVQAHEALMIGDNLDADVLGAENAGIPAIHFNPMAHQSIAKREISHLGQLLDWID